MSARDRDRLKVLHEAERGYLTQPQAGGQLRLGERATHPKRPTCPASPRSSARRNLKYRTGKEASCPAVEHGRRRRLTHTPSSGLPLRFIQRGHQPRLPRFNLLRYV